VNGLPCKSVSLVQGDVIRAGDTLFVVTTRDFAAEMNDLIARVAHAPFPVLLTGETGSGKEVTARAIHAGSARRGPFVALNCATLSRDLAAAELFGHVSGAFSGAGAPRPGLFRAAEGGTLFLDEIGDLPLDIQASLLRAIEERRVRPVGSDKEIPIDVRLLSATHVDLERAVEARAFRADLFSRLAHLVIQVPPLRERRAEILELASKFAPEVTISANAAEALLLWSWPRNVRELRAVVEVSQLLSRGRSTLRLSDLKDRLPQTLSLIRSRKSEPPGAGEGEPDRHPLADRREQLTLLLETHSGNIKKIADELGKPRAQVYRWVKSLGLDLDRFRKV
jgi:DNA-binding NtrC family response regulator